MEVLSAPPVHLTVSHQPRRGDTTDSYLVTQHRVDVQRCHAVECNAEGSRIRAFAGRQSKLAALCYKAAAAREVFQAGSIHVACDTSNIRVTMRKGRLLQSNLRSASMALRWQTWHAIAFWGCWPLRSLLK